MKKIITTFIFIFLTTNLILAQTSESSIIINSKSDVIEQANSKTISFYIKGLAPKQINSFSDKISTVSGLKLSSLKITDADLKMAHGKIELQNNYNKRALTTILKQFEITTVIYDGKPTPVEKFFYNNKNSRGVSK